MQNKKEVVLISPVKRLNKDVVKRYDLNERMTEVFLKNASTHQCMSQWTYNKTSLDFLLRMKEIRIPEQYCYIADYFMGEHIRWYEDSYVFINTGTGTGKTTFIEKMADLHRYRILVLTNRKANREQILKHLREAGHSGFGSMIKVISYQELEKNTALTSDILDDYDFLVCDESHYFLADSDFNSLTNLSLQKIMDTHHAIKIFMSATNDNVQEMIIRRLAFRHKNDVYVAQKVFVYHMKRTATLVRNIIGFESFEMDLAEQIIKSNEKWMIFVKSIAQGREIYFKLLKKMGDDVIFLDRESADEGTDEQRSAFRTLVEEETFIQRVCITTCLLDNGVNVKCPLLKHIVIFDDDPIEIVQMCGRKRTAFNENDYFDLYLINESNQSLAVSLVNKIAKKKDFKSVKKDVEELHELDIVHYLNTKDGNEYRNMSFYDPYVRDYMFNYLGYSKVCKEIKTLNELRRSDEPFELKVSWVLNKLNGNIIGKITTSMDIQKERFMRQIEVLLDTEFPYSTKKEKISFHKLVSECVWNVFKKMPGERSDRPMDLEKLNNKFLHLDLPLEIILNEDIVKIRRKV